MRFWVQSFEITYKAILMSKIGELNNRIRTIRRN